ncbi:hypothetical protein [Sphingobium sp.]
MMTTKDKKVGGAVGIFLAFTAIMAATIGYRFGADIAQRDNRQAASQPIQ